MHAKMLLRQIEHKDDEQGWIPTFVFICTEDKDGDAGLREE